MRIALLQNRWMYDEEVLCLMYSVFVNLHTFQDLRQQPGRPREHDVILGGADTTEE